MLIGVAASSSFAHSSDVILSPGQHATVNGYTMRYVVRPSRRRSPTRARWQSSPSAPCSMSPSTARHVTTLTTTRGLLSRHQRSDRRPDLGRLQRPGRFARSACKAGLTRDIWTVVNLNFQPIQARDQPRRQGVHQPDDQPDARAGQPTQDPGGDPGRARPGHRRSGVRGSSTTPGRSTSASSSRRWSRGSGSGRS